MTILVAMDSFKGSLSSSLANRAVQEGIHLINPSERVRTVTVADGGEGTIEALRHPFQLDLNEYPVLDAIGTVKKATYGYNTSTKVAVIEVAQICGLPEIPENLRDPVHATTYGVGELILAAIEKGATHLYIGLGGSATTDGGFGMLRALGIRFFDENEEESTDRKKEQMRRWSDCSMTGYVAWRQSYSRAKESTFNVYRVVERQED